jgi:S1-C subfamily serine protease
VSVRGSSRLLWLAILGAALDALALEGRRIDTVGKLLGRPDEFKVGDTVKLTVARDGREREVEITLQPGA